MPDLSPVTLQNLGTIPAAGVSVPCEMTHRSKRTSAPAPQEISSTSAQPVPPPPWCPPLPPQSMAPSSTPYWFAGLQHPGMAGSLRQGPWWAPGSNGPSANHEDFNLQAWGLDSHPPGGFVNLLEKNTPSQAQVVSNGSSSQPINVGNDTNSDKCARTEKRLVWTNEEDLKLVSAWLNNSNDPIQANYKKNDQYWKDVTAVLNSSILQNRARLVKQVKDHFARIKKRVAWFCGSWKEANAL
ncbi:glutathione S-transferase T3-like [Panicum miliaceum]|uniref:Glutathione S-transferase T3-like n=1 Tax=Panicum miliaceum TaxID=4540 RepID=A0A3L6SS11_PANMI|nr:glutathione S-transferase T3-like [Panicum miliaceum]